MKNIHFSVIIAIVLFSVQPLMSGENQVSVGSVQELQGFLEDVPEHPEEEIVVRLEAGTYQLQAILPPRITLVGAGTDETIIQGVEDEAAVLSLSYNTTLKDLTVDVPYTTILYAIYAPGQKNVLLQNVHVRGAYTYGLYFDSSRNVQLLQCTVNGHDYGVFFKDTIDFVVRDSVIVGNGFTGIYLDNSEGEIINNLIAYNAGHGVFSTGTFLYYMRLFAQRRYDIEKNLFFHNGAEKDSHKKNLVFDQTNIVLRELGELDEKTGIIDGIETLNEEYEMSLPFRTE